MFSGAITATLVLIVLYAVVQPGAAKHGTEATDVLVTTLKRFGSPGVAGIGDHSRKGSAKPTATTTPGGYMQPVYNV